MHLPVTVIVFCCRLAGSCDAGAETIADCYQRKVSRSVDAGCPSYGGWGPASGRVSRMGQMAANAAHRGYIGAIVFLPALLVRSAVLGRLWLDYYRVGMQQPIQACSVRGCIPKQGRTNRPAVSDDTDP